MKVLTLNLNYNAFDTMFEGLKDREYRVNKSSNWIKNRLVSRKTGKDREYDVVKFIRGYGKKNPYFVTTYKGYEIAKKNYTVRYKNDFSVKVLKGTYRILLGSIIKKGNHESIELF